MKVILAEPRGFCAGVTMAIAALERAIANFGVPLYVYHEIVHNRRVVESFRQRGVLFVDRLAEVPAGGVLLYSAHGVSPKVRHEADERRLRTIDATCPLVEKVHREALDFIEAGYVVVLIGHAGHDEVIGTLDTAPGRIVLVSRVEDVDQLDFCSHDRVAYVTQTTLSLDDAAQIVERLRQRFPRLKGPQKQDICCATQHRQEAVKRLASDAQLVLVVGSPNSSNSQRLVEIARRQGVTAHLIDGVGDVDPCWFHGVKSVLMTAGASAPDEVVNECVSYLVEHFGATVEDHRRSQASINDSTVRWSSCDHEGSGVMPARVRGREEKSCSATARAGEGK